VQVVGLGYCSWDYLGILDHIPEFDAPTVGLHDFAMSGGGPVSTALVTLARLGARAGYIGSTGDDEPGLSLRRAFEAERVDISHLRVESGARTPVCMVLVQRASGKRTILCYRGTYHDVQLNPADQSYITSARFLHLDGHHMDAAITAAQWMRQHSQDALPGQSRTVVLDANRPRPRLDELLPWVDVLITNGSFPTDFTGAADLPEATEKLLRYGARLVVTTLGEQGCYCRTADGDWRVPGLPVKVVDTTGAGDAFHGAFIYGLLRQWPIERAATFANAVAALNCTALGGRAALPSLAQVEAFLKTSGRW